jgi:hypothetical protein
MIQPAGIVNPEKLSFGVTLCKYLNNSHKKKIIPLNSMSFNALLNNPGAPFPNLSDSLITCNFHELADVR